MSRSERFLLSRVTGLQFVAQNLVKRKTSAITWRFRKSIKEHTKWWPMKTPTQIKRLFGVTDATSTFPQVLVTGGGRGEWGEGLASVAGCHSGSGDHLPPSCWCPVIPEPFITARWESDMRCTRTPELPAFLTFPCGSPPLIAVRTALMYPNTHPSCICMYFQSWFECVLRTQQHVTWHVCLSDLFTAACVVTVTTHSTELKGPDRVFARSLTTNYVCFFSQ